MKVKAIAQGARAVYTRCDLEFEFDFELNSESEDSIRDQIIKKVHSQFEEGEFNINNEENRDCNYQEITSNNCDILLWQSID
jgi:hypothetical protein